MNKAFTKFAWVNYPSTDTALEADRLNLINNALDTVDNRVVTMNASKLDVVTANTMVKDVSFDEATGIFTIVKLNGSTFKIDTKLEKLAINWKFDHTKQQLIIVLDDGTEEAVDLSALITQYEFKESDTIILAVDTDGKVYGSIKKGSITADCLEPNYLANVTEKADTATLKAKEAEESAKSAEESAQNAAKSESNALEAAGVIDKMGGTVEITDSNPTKENIVLTIDPTEQEVLLYTADEVDDKVQELKESISEIKELLVDGNEVAY